MIQHQDETDQKDEREREAAVLGQHQDRAGDERRDEGTSDEQRAQWLGAKASAEPFRPHEIGEAD